MTSTTGSSWITTAEFTTTNSSLETTDSSGYHYILPYTDAWVIVSTCILAVFFLFGVSANTLTVVVIQTSPRLQNRYYTFITSMCASDIVSSFVSILFLYRRTWGFLFFAWPEFFCRLYWGVDLWTSFATALHILSFAVLRMIGVKWPTVFKRISPRHMTIWIGGIWFLTFTCAFVPHFLFNTVKIVDRENDPENARWASCSLDPKWIPTWQIYVQIVYAFFLYLPATLIIGISCWIAYILKKRKPPGDRRANDRQLTSVSKSIADSTETLGSSTVNVNIQHKPTTRHRQKSAVEMNRYKKDKQAIIQLWLIVGSFLFGYIPLTAYHFYTGFTLSVSDNVTNAIDWRFAMVQYLLLRFSECLNPVFYNLASAKMRHETKRFLYRIIRKRDPNSAYQTNRSIATSSNV